MNASEGQIRNSRADMSTTIVTELEYVERKLGRSNKTSTKKLF